MHSDHGALQELLMFWPDQADPVFVILQLDIWVFLIGIPGMTRLLLTLADELMATSPVLDASQHDPIRDPKLGMAPVLRLSRTLRGNHHRHMPDPQQPLCRSRHDHQGRKTPFYGVTPKQALRTFL